MCLLPGDLSPRCLQGCFSLGHPKIGFRRFISFTVPFPSCSYSHFSLTAQTAFWRPQTLYPLFCFRDLYCTPRSLDVNAVWGFKKHFIVFAIMGTAIHGSSRDLASPDRCVTHFSSIEIDVFYSVLV